MTGAFRPDQCLDRDRNGIQVASFQTAGLNRQQVIDRIVALVQNDLAPFNVAVETLGPGAVVPEGQNSTTIFVGPSTTCHPHVAGDIDVGNNNRTDIAFVGVENWGTVDRTAVALADVVLHEAGHTYGLYHVNSGNQPETMGWRYSTPQSQWVADTGFLDRTFAIKPGHGPAGPQNSYQVMSQLFGNNPFASPSLSPPLDLTPPPPGFVPTFHRLDGHGTRHKEVQVASTNALVRPSGGPQGSDDQSVKSVLSLDELFRDRRVETVGNAIDAESRPVELDERTKPAAGPYAASHSQGVGSLGAGHVASAVLDRLIQELFADLA